jgi:hypothetical protein
VPLEELIRKGASRVALTECCEESLAIDVASSGTGTGLEVVGQSAGGDEGGRAEWACDFGAAVESRIAMLSKHQSNSTEVVGII